MSLGPKLNVGGEMSSWYNRENKPWRPKSKATKFPWSMWRWTGSDESLFDLDKDQLEWFRALVSHA